MVNSQSWQAYKVWIRVEYRLIPEISCTPAEKKQVFISCVTSWMIFFLRYNIRIVSLMTRLMLLHSIIEPIDTINLIILFFNHQKIHIRVLRLGLIRFIGSKDYTSRCSLQKKTSCSSRYSSSIQENNHVVLLLLLEIPPFHSGLAARSGLCSCWAAEALSSWIGPRRSGAFVAYPPKKNCENIDRACRPVAPQPTACTTTERHANLCVRRSMPGSWWLQGWKGSR